MALSLLTINREETTFLNVSACAFISCRAQRGFEESESVSAICHIYLDPDTDSDSDSDFW
jgi:hypothetical protein